MKSNPYNFLSLLQEQEAFLQGHFRLPCGLHSKVYIKALDLMKHGHISKKVAEAMAKQFSAQQADVVLAPNQNIFVLARAVASARGARAAYAEGTQLGPNFIIKPSETVLIVDDVAVSGRQISTVCNLVKSIGAKLIGVSVMVDRSDGELNIGAPMRALLSYPLVTYEEANCPLCKLGIPLNK